MSDILIHLLLLVNSKMLKNVLHLINEYAILIRDTTSWINAIDLMRNLKPNIMVPQHTRPIAGEMVIMDILTSYRDAIQFVRDQTIRYMNKGLKNSKK